MVLCIPADVGADSIGVVHGTWFATQCTDVIVVNITTMGVTVVPILPPFAGIGRMHVLLLTTTRTDVIHGWLLWETTVVALTTTVALVVVVERALLLSGGIAAAWGLLANIHTELDVRKLVLHCDQNVGLALHCFLRGCKRSTKVCKQVIVRDDQSVIIHGGHSVTMLQGQDSSLIDKSNHVGPIFLEGVDRLGDWWDHVLARDPVFVLLGVHSTMLDDAQANINDITVIHRVACSAGVGSLMKRHVARGLKPSEGCHVAAVLCRFSS